LGPFLEMCHLLLELILALKMKLVWVINLSFAIQKLAYIQKILFIKFPKTLFNNNVILFEYVLKFILKCKFSLLQFCECDFISIFIFKIYNFHKNIVSLYLKIE
jgi:hypothetical protein